MKLTLLLTFLATLLTGTAVVASELTQSDVEKVIKTAPIVVAWFDKAKQSMSEEALSTVGNATFEGNLHEAFGKAASGNPEATATLEAAATENGFASYSEFANAADRAYSLLAVNTVMSASASMGKDTRVNNIYEYLNLDSTPADEKVKLEGYMPGMYERLNADPADLPMVLKNFDSLKAALIR